MSSHSHRKESSSIIAFTAVVAIGVALVGGASVKLYDYGRKSGEKERVLNPPPPPREDSAPKVYDLRQLRKPSEELVAMGAKIYTANCASCHGESGAGDGAGGARLVVKPRNFTTAQPGEYKNGASTLSMYKTLNEGVGGNMPAFPTLNPEQKFAVIHYVHKWFPSVPEDTADQIAALPAPSAGSAGGPVVVDSGPRVSIDYVIAKMATDARSGIRRPAPDTTGADAPLGAKLWAANCASCHGPSGEGGIPLRLMNKTPQIRYAAESIQGSTAPWVSDKAAFTSIVTKGLPGKAKPGIATLTEEEMEELYRYTRSLAMRRQMADASGQKGDN